MLELGCDAAAGGAAPGPQARGARCSQAVYSEGPGRGREVGRRIVLGARPGVMCSGCSDEPSSPRPLGAPWRCVQETHTHMNLGRAAQASSASRARCVVDTSGSSQASRGAGSEHPQLWGEEGCQQLGEMSQDSDALAGDLVRARPSDRGAEGQTRCTGVCLPSNQSLHGLSVNHILKY